MDDDKVVVWRSFPSPDGTRGRRSHSSPKHNACNWPSRELDEDDLQRWRRLADFPAINDEPA